MLEVEEIYDEYNRAKGILRKHLSPAEYFMVTSALYNDMIFSPIFNIKDLKNATNPEDIILCINWIAAEERHGIHPDYLNNLYVKLLKRSPEPLLIQEDGSYYD